MVTLLFLGVNPLDTEGVRTDEEFREIENRLSSSPGNQIEVRAKWAVRAQDLQKALLEFNPAIVHFSGHGNRDGQILLESPAGYAEAVTPQALADLFKAFSSTVRCVVLNACNSAEQARLLAQSIDCSIGMAGPISVGAGKAFTVSFYQALAYGKDVATAFELGRNQIRLENYGEDGMPQLYIREGIGEVHPAAISIPSTGPTTAIEAFVRAQLSLTARALGLSEKLSLAPMAYEEEPPPIVEKCSTRATTIARIHAEVADRRWYAMYGGIGTGKTHLGVLLASQHTGRRVWLRLRDRAPAQALAIIDYTLAQIKQRQGGQSRAAWYEECCDALGHDAVLTLDDVPRTSGHEEIDDALVFLGRAARRANITLITIAPLPLSPPTRLAAADQVLEEPIPAFDENEIRELLAAHGAPAAFLTSAWTTIVSAICRQHPLLLAEAARFLEAKGWQVSGQAFKT